MRNIHWSQFGSQGGLKLKLIFKTYSQTKTWLNSVPTISENDDVRGIYCKGHLPQKHFQMGVVLKQGGGYLLLTLEGEY